jgi:hypothetical protein
MRKWFAAKVLLAVFLFTICAHAQSDSTLPEPTQNPDAAYRLFRTRNVYTLLKLDTRTGQLSQVQWGEEGDRFTEVINQAVLVPIGTATRPTALKPGRFTLCPTPNIYTFLLLDQEDGRTWQVQWGDSKHRFIVAIP